MAKQGISRRFSVKNSREKSVQRQQASQTDTSRHHQQNLQEKPGEKLQQERERIAGSVCQQQDRHQWPELCRAEATACRMAAPRGFMRAVSGLYQVYLRPPIVPPSPMQEPHAIPAKSTASTTSTAGRQPAPASTGHQHHQRRGKSHTAQNHQHQQTAHTTAPQPAPAHATASQHHTRPGRSAQRRRRPARRSPPARPGGRRYSRRGL